MQKPWNDLGAGETWRGFWDSGLTGPLPVLAARGTRPGPTLLVTAGVHGDEYEGPAAVAALFRGLDAGALAGRVIGLPVANAGAWAARARTAPGGSDLNRTFPGVTGADGTDGLAAVIFTEFVHECDVLWDLHSGGTALVHLPLAGWYAGGADAERLARSSGAGLRPWLIPDVPGVLSFEAHRLGKIAVGAEWGGGGRLDPAGAEAYAAALQSSLAVLGMTRANSLPPAAPDSRRPVGGDYQTAPCGGLFMPSVLLGDEVAQGAALGTIVSLLGDALCPLHAAGDGIVAGLPSLPWLRAGDRAAYVG